MSGDQDKIIQKSLQRTDELSLINFSDFTIMKLLSKGTNCLVTWAKLKRIIRVGRSRKGLWDTGVASMRLVENCIHIGQPNVITGGLPWTIGVTITSITIRRTNDPSGPVRFSSWK